MNSKQDKAIGVLIDLTEEAAEALGQSRTSSILSQLWAARGYSLMPDGEGRAIPVPLGTNIFYKLGEPDPLRAYRAKFEEAQRELHGGSDEAVDEED